MLKPILQVLPRQKVSSLRLRGRAFSSALSEKVGEQLLKWRTGHIQGTCENKIELHCLYGTKI